MERGYTGLEASAATVQFWLKSCSLRLVAQNQLNCYTITCRGLHGALAFRLMG